MDALFTLDKQIQSSIQQYNLLKNDESFISQSLSVDIPSESFKLLSEMSLDTINDELYELYKLITPTKYIIHDLLKYELMNISPLRVQVNVESFIELAMFYLNRYQHKAGGFSLEDSDWTVYTSSNKKYDINDNIVIFENSTTDLRDEIYLDSICKLLNKITLNSKTKVKMPYTSPILWILLKTKIY